LATGSAIGAAPAFGVNGDRLTSSVAGHAAAEVSPIPTASAGLLLLHSLGAHHRSGLHPSDQRRHVEAVEL